MKVLVTGATGFLGHNVTRACLNNGHDVRVLVRTTSDTSRIDGLDIERAIGDIQDPESLRAAMEAIEGVIHLAGISDWMDVQRDDMHRSIVNGTKNILEAAAATGSPKVVYASTISSINGTPSPTVMNEETEATVDFDEPGFVFCKAKRDAEELCLEHYRSGLPVIITHPPETFGPNDTSLITTRNLINMWQSWPVLVSNGGVCVAHAEDVAQAFVRALERGRPGERYVFGGENITVRQLAEMMFDLLNTKRLIVQLPNWFIKGLTKVATTLRIPLPYNPLMVPFATRFWFFTSEKAQRELDVQFRPAKDVLRPTVQWLKEEGYLDRAPPKDAVRSA